jgi:hypothetical protein
MAVYTVNLHDGFRFKYVTCGPYYELLGEMNTGLRSTNITCTLDKVLD